MASLILPDVIVERFPVAECLRLGGVSIWNYNGLSLDSDRLGFTQESE
jgi:hypothetical protein